uniref:Uncharacterized protein n=1 Tax=Arundo donax TaxID=35708 RepID=A0A0A9C4T3_ARUDO
MFLLFQQLKPHLQKLEVEEVEGVLGSIVPCHLLFTFQPRLRLDLHRGHAVR